MKFKIILSFLLSLSFFKSQFVSAMEISPDEEIFKEPSLSSYIDKVLRPEITCIGDESINNSYTKIHKHWQHYVHARDQGRPFTTTSRCWEFQTFNDKTKPVTSLAWKPEIEPCIQKALEDILCSSTFTNSCNASLIVRIKLLLDVLKLEKMETYVTEIVEKFELQKGSVKFLRKLAEGIWSRASVYPGISEDQRNSTHSKNYYIWFSNIPSYLDYKTDVENHYQEVMRLSDGKYVGFDPILFATPVTYEELERHMYSQFFCPETTRTDNREKYEKLCEDLAGKEGFEKFKILRREHQRKFEAKQLKSRNIFCLLYPHIMGLDFDNFGIIYLPQQLGKFGKSSLKTAQTG